MLSNGTSTAEPSQGLQNRPHLGTNNAGRDTVAVKEKFAHYFMSEAGRVHWQDNIWALQEPTKPTDFLRATQSFCLKAIPFHHQQTYTFCIL